MSLHRQLCASLIIVIAILLATSAAISLHSARQHLLTHVSEHAQETTALLAYVLATPADASSRATAAALLNTAFEQGTYDALIYRDPQGNTLFERHKPVRVLPIPTWFIHFFSLTAPSLAPLSPSAIPRKARFKSRPTWMRHT